jgi:hypothetical protein
MLCGNYMGIMWEISGKSSKCRVESSKCKVPSGGHNGENFDFSWGGRTMDVLPPSAEWREQKEKYEDSK